MTPETSIYEYAKQALNISADKPAIWFHDKSITYRELFEMIDNVADHLAQLGVKEGTVVTIHLPNCPQAVIAIYAVAKLGGICSMVHPQMPEEALKNYINFTESTFLISNDQRILVCGNVETSIYVDVISALTCVSQAGPRPGMVFSFSEMILPCQGYTAVCASQAFIDKCAVYMHSTGTTGVPKTVMLSHWSLNYWVEDIREYFEGETLHDMVGLSVSPFYHCIGFLADMHRALSFGAQVVILERWSSDTAVAAIKTHRVSIMTGVPSMYMDLLRNTAFSGNGVAQLRYCLMGGDFIPNDLILHLDSRTGHQRTAFPVYGLTEVGGGAAAINRLHDRLGAVGYPLKGVSFAVLDATGGVTHAGEGELLIRSRCMMMGYLKDFQATESAFVTVEDQLWLRTGDYGRVDQDGFVYFIGRIKDVIIRKGNIVFPNEVENVICSLPITVEACVFGIHDAVYGTEKVCAAVVLRQGENEEIARETILQACRQMLPRYAVPGKIVFKTQLPYNKLGKVDRKALA